MIDQTIPFIIKNNFMFNVKTLAFIALFSFFASPSTVKAQEVVSPAGKHFSNETIQISWTLGEPVINTITGENELLTQGFHQSKLVVTAISEIPELALDILAYPNPTTDYLNVSVKNAISENLRYTLYNTEGKVLTSKQISSDISEISMTEYASSIYFLKISEKNRELKTFKIIKK